MAHVVKEVQQHHLMHLIRKNMGGDTAYLTFDFKQKFLSKGFREGGDAYYGKKGTLWFGVAAFVKNQNSLHVMMPFEAIPDDGKEVDDSLNEGDRVIEGDSDGVDEGDRVEESDRVDEGDRVNESDRVDESDTVDESDRVDESDKVDESEEVNEDDGSVKLSCKNQKIILSNWTHHVLTPRPRVKWVKTAKIWGRFKI